MVKRFDGGTALLVLNFVAYALAYLFYVIMSRLYAIADFGTVGVYLSILGVVSLVTPSLMLSASKLAAEGGLEKGSIQVFFKSLKYWSAAAIMLTIILATLFGPSALFLGISILLLPYRDVLFGTINGMGKNTTFGLLLIFESSFRIGILALWFLFPVIWLPLAAWSAAYGIDIILALFVVPRGSISANRPDLPAKARDYTIEAATLRVPQVVFMFTDVLLVGALLVGSKDVGLYVAASVLAKIPFYLITPHILGLFPEIVSKKEPRVISRGILLGGTLSTIAVVGCWPLAPYALSISFGSQYLPSTGILLVLFFASHSMILTNALGMLFIALGKGRISGAIVTVGCLIDVTLCWTLIPMWGLVGASIAVAASTTLTFLFLALAFAFLFRNSRPSKGDF